MSNCRVAFVGTPEFAVPCLRALHQLPGAAVVTVITQPDKPLGRHRTVTPPAVKQAAATLGIPVLQPSTIRGAEFQRALPKLQLDLAVIVAYGKIVPPALLAVPSHGWLNMHASLLPRYRGASPIQAAILNGDAETGVTAMQLDAGLDTGPIVNQKKIRIRENETASTLHDRLATLSAQLLAETVPAYLRGDLVPHPQPAGQYPATKPVESADGRIDWQGAADQIERQIRAYSPSPGTYCSWGTRRLKILAANVNAGSVSGTAGQVRYAGGRLTVQCGHGTLELLSLQLEGKKPMAAGAFIRGYGALTGSTLA